MSVTTSTMTDEQRRSVAIEFLKRIDRGDDVLGLFADDAQLYFPKHPLANGIDEIKQVFGNVGGIVAWSGHDYAYMNFVHSGDTLVVEVTSSGRTADGGGVHAELRRRHRLQAGRRRDVAIGADAARRGDRGTRAGRRRSR